MILPIFISVSLAPGSYFFSAFAAVAVIAAAAAATTAIAIRRRLRAGIVLSSWRFHFLQASQVGLAHASIRFIPRGGTVLLPATNDDWCISFLNRSCALV